MYKPEGFQGSERQYLTHVCTHSCWGVSRHLHCLHAPASLRLFPTFTAFIDSSEMLAILGNSVTFCLSIKMNCLKAGAGGAGAAIN